MVKTQSTNNTTALSRLIFWVASFALIASFTIFVLEKAQVTNLYTKPQITAPQASPISNVAPVNTVDYSSPSNDEKTDGDTIKQQAAEKGQKDQSTTSNTISVSLSAAGQDTKGGPIVFRAMINGTNGGQCKLVISGNSVNKEYSADVENLGTYYGCKGFDIPVSDISSGSYSATLTVVNGNSKGTITQTIEVEK